MLLPEFVAGPSTSDSLRYNIVWLDQWRELVADGNLYPRWMPRAWDGLGSPAFIFYPPLFFWIAVGFDQLTLRLLETGTLLSLTSAILLGASGLTMRHWLRAHVGAGTALLGALAYMLAPYHLYDIFARAALAETCAYAVLPLVLLGIKRASEGNASALLALAVAYASLILSHLPVALLASVTLVPAYALFVTRRVGALARLAAAGLLGLGLAAIYLIPALTEGHTILAQALNTIFYRPENWFFWHSGVLSRPIMWIVFSACLAAVLLAFAAAIGADGEGRARTLFWAASSLAIVLLIAGVPPAFWRLPPIAQVQFPWRLMVVLEFAVITCVALSAQRLVKPLALLAAVPLTGAVCLAALLSAQRLDASPPAVAGRHRHHSGCLPRRARISTRRVAFASGTGRHPQSLAGSASASPARAGQGGRACVRAGPWRWRVDRRGGKLVPHYGDRPPLPPRTLGRRRRTRSSRADEHHA